MRTAAAAGAVLFVALVAVFTIINAQEPPPAELAGRCDASQPAWNGYQEDIKEIGARQVAAWHGEPVSLDVQPDEIRVAMALSPPWDESLAALPLLLKDPEGLVHRNAEAVRDGALRVYVFRGVSGLDIAPPPWLDLQYPHTKRRIYLDPEGHWRASDEGQE